jgi:hypothetical protein
MPLSDVSDLRLPAGVVSAAIRGDHAAVQALVSELAPVVQVRVATGLLAGRPRGRMAADARGDVEAFTEQTVVALFADSGRALRAWDSGRGVPLVTFVGFFAEWQVAAILARHHTARWTDALLGEAPPNESPQPVDGSRDAAVVLVERVRACLTPRGLHLFQLVAVEGRTVESACLDVGLTAAEVSSWKSDVAGLARSLAAVPLPPPLADAMDEDALLAALGRLAREGAERAAKSARWEKLATRGLSPDEETALEAEAKKDPELQLQYAAFQPLSDETKARLAAEVLAQKPTTLRGWHWGAILLIPIAIALALTAANARRNDALYGPVPPYALLVASGAGPAVAVGDPAKEKIAVPPTGSVGLVLEPSRSVEGSVAVRAFLVRDGQAQLLPIIPQISPTGAVNIALHAAYFPSPGAWELVLAVGREGELPTDPGVIAMIVGGYNAKLSWRIVRANLTVP